MLELESNKQIDKRNLCLLSSQDLAIDWSYCNKRHGKHKNRLHKGAFNNYVDRILPFFDPSPKLYIPSTLNIDLTLWHTQLIVCAENVKSWVFPFTFQAYILPHTLNCMCVSLLKFHI